MPLQPHRLSTDGAVPLQPPGLGTCSYELNDRVERRRIAIRRIDLERRGAEVDLELLSAGPLLLEDFPIEMHWVSQTSGTACGEALPAECLRRAAEHDPRICDASQIPKPRRRAIAVKVRFEDHRRPARERAYRDGPHDLKGGRAELAGARPVACAQDFCERLLYVVLGDDRDPKPRGELKGERGLPGSRRAPDENETRGRRDPSYLRSPRARSPC